MKKLSTIARIAAAIGAPTPPMTRPKLSNCACGQQHTHRGWHCSDCHKHAQRAAHEIPLTLAKALKYMRRYPVKNDGKQVGFMYPYGEIAEYRRWEYK